MFILARFISTFGNWFASMAVPFMIYDITGSARAVSISFLLETLFRYSNDFVYSYQL